MIRLFRQFAYRYLKQQKKHTVLTIIAIIIAVAFMTVMLSAVSIYSATSANITRSTTGSYHVLINSLDRDETVVIGGMDIFDEVETYSLSYYTSTVDGVFEGDTVSKQYLACNGYIVEDWFLRIRPDDISMLPDYMTSVIEGRLPEKDGEVVINAANTALWGDPSLGDTVTLYTLDCSALSESTDNSAYSDFVPGYFLSSVNIDGYNEITFTVVGFSDGYNMVHYNDTRFSSGTESYNNLLARFTDECMDPYWDLHYVFQDVGLEIDDFDYSLNQDLLNEEGHGNDAQAYRVRFFAVCYLFILFLMFCVRMVIDNSFEISSRERVKQFGLLKAVGASSSQIFRIIVWEALLLSAVGVPVGILLGWGVTRIIFGILSSMESLNSISSVYNFTDMLVFNVQWFVYAIALAAGVLWVVISAVGTGMRVVRATPVDAMRMASRREKIYTGRFRAKLGNGKKFVPVYASLSMKRNKKRYIVTMLSMVLSIVLFSGFSYVIELAKDNVESTFAYDRLPYDFSVNISTYSTDGVDYSVELLEDSGYFEDIQYDTSVMLYTDSESMGVSFVSGKEAQLSFLDIHPVNRNTYEKYITSSVTYDELLESGSVLICANAIEYTTDSETYTLVDSVTECDLTAEQFIPAEVNFYGGTASIHIGGTYVTDSSLYLTITGKITCSAVIAEENYLALVEQCGRDGNSTLMEFSDGSTAYLYTRTIGANAKDGCVDEARTFLTKYFYGYYDDNLNDRESTESLLSLISMAGYFLIITFSLIAAVNVANIISTNVLNRFSELGILRACGMSDKQLYSLVRTESLMYAVLAGISSAVAIALMVIIVQIPFEQGWGYLSSSDLIADLSVVAPMKYVAVATVAALLVAVVSSYFPGKRVVDSPVVESIRDVD